MLKRFEAFSQFLLPFAVMAFITGEILLPKIPFSDVAGTSNKIRYDDFMLVLTVAVWAIGLWWLKKRFFTHVAHQAVFFFWFVTAVSLVSALILTQTVSSHVAVLNWLRRIEYMSVFFVGLSAIRNRFGVIRILLVMLAAGIVTIFYAFGQIYFHWCSISTTNREFAKGECVPLTTGTRPNATFGNQAEFAIFLGFAIPIIISLFFAANKLWQKVVLAAVLLMYFGMIIITQARWPFVAALATIVTMLWLYGQKKLLAGFVVVAVIGVGLVGRNLLTRYVTTAKTIIMPQSQQSQATIPIDKLIYQTTTAGGRTEITDSAILGQESLLDEDQYRKAHPQQYLQQASPALEAQRSTSIRFQQEWPTALRAFLRNPLLGSGYSALADQYGNTAADNDYLRSLGETGLLGTAALGLIIFILVKAMYQMLKRTKGTHTLTRNLTIGFTAAIAGFFINAVFIDVFESSKLATLFWVLCGIMLALTQMEQRKETV